MNDLKLTQHCRSDRRRQSTCSIERLLLAESSRWWHRVASGRFTPIPATQVLEFRAYREAAFDPKRPATFRQFWRGDWTLTDSIDGSRLVRILAY